MQLANQYRIMKKLGLVGGTSWVSTIEYYTKINEGINQELGDLNFAECMIYSFNFQEIVKLTETNDWDAILEMILSACKKLEHGGVDAIMLCANTMHFVADKLENDLTVPLIHIAKETASVIKQFPIKKVGLLGTKFTMENDFFRSKLIDKEIDVIIPDSDDREFIHDSIFKELSKGIIKEATKERYLSIIQQLKSKGAEGIIAGCTEIPLIVNASDIDLTYFDTTDIHAKSAIKFSLS